MFLRHLEIMLQKYETQAIHFVSIHPLVCVNPDGAGARLHQSLGERQDRLSIHQEPTQKHTITHTFVCKDNLDKTLNAPPNVHGTLDSLGSHSTLRQAM